jgi:hypothetical protein
MHQAPAQDASASVSGSVFDELGGPVIAARLALKANDGRLYLGRTTEQGTFRILRIAPGTYVLNIDQNGYCRPEIPAMVLKSAEQRVLPKINLAAPPAGQECP